jgi:serine/threonine-protein kinase
MTDRGVKEQTAADLALCQSRVSRFGRLLACVGLAYMAVHLGFSGWLHQPLFDLEILPETIATIAFTAQWLLLRGPTRTAGFLRFAELGGLLVGTAAFSAMALVLPLVAQPEPIVRGALTYILLAYAAYVPGTVKRTLFVGVAMTVPLAVCMFLAMRHWDPALHDPPAATWPKGPVGSMAPSITIYSLVWWSVAVAIAAGISKVIYGLRKEVRDSKRLGQYALEEKLGEGGMGVVYRASHAMLRRPTAVKLLLPGKSTDAALARFEREVRRTAMLTHPNTVTVFDFGRTEAGVFYYAMELLDGVTLSDVIDLDGPQSDERVIHLLLQAAGALAEAHDAGLIHRDIKPANILLVNRGGIPDLVKVVDFGLVKDVRTEDPEVERSAVALLTHANTITGTPLYMSPEAITDPETIDGRSDLYALGAVGYWLLTGTHVFEARSVVEVCSHHLHTAPESPSKRRGTPVAPDLEALLLSCLAKSPIDRPADAHALRAALHACTSAQSWTSERGSAWWRENDGRIRELRRSRTTTSTETRGAALGATITRLPV